MDGHRKVYRSRNGVAAKVYRSRNGDISVLSQFAADLRGPKRSSNSTYYIRVHTCLNAHTNLKIIQSGQRPLRVFLFLRLFFSKQSCQGFHLISTGVSLDKQRALLLGIFRRSSLGVSQDVGSAPRPRVHARGDTFTQTSTQAPQDPAQRNNSLDLYQPPCRVQLPSLGTSQIYVKG